MIDGGSGDPPAPGDEAGYSWWRRRRVAIGVAVAVLALVAGAGALLAVRYLPALDEARALRTDLETMVDRVQAAGLGVDRSTVDRLDADLASAGGRLAHLHELLSTDPLVGLARILPPTSSNVRGADDVVTAAGDLLDAAGDGLAIGRRFVEIKEARTAGAESGSTLSQLVELMATSRDRAVAAQAAVSRAVARLAAVPDGLIAPIEGVRDAMTARADKYSPLLDAYVTASARLPAILGWDTPRRYLVLTQDPAELRPTGGFIGSYGIVAFDRGRITERRFQDVVPLDIPWDYPAIKPPQALADYLLGPKQPWQFADSNWSPDFPTSARDAIRLYTNESGDARIDGVFGITTYTIDELLKVTGPITVVGYDATIAAGETTLKVLQQTRSAEPGVDRKAFLPAFADELLASLFALPPTQWGDLLGAADAFGRGHLLEAWFADPADQAFVAAAGFDGAVRQDPGDYLFPVDTNVAPATKLSFMTSRALDLSVQIDEVGNARNILDVTWNNEFSTPGAAIYRSMTNIGGSILGMYFRLLVPDRSRVESVSGGGLAPVTDPAVVETEAGRMVIGTYLKIPPGRTSLRYTWTSPYPAEADADGGTYRLTIQTQPGALPGPLRLTIHAPDGLRITAATPGLEVAGATATLTSTLDRDIVVGVRYGH